MIQPTQLDATEIRYWPWVVLLGWPVALACLFLGRRAGARWRPRLALSLVAALSVAPAYVNRTHYEDLVLSAAGLARHLLSLDLHAWLYVLIITGPPVFVITVMIFGVWTFLLEQRQYALDGKGA